jgi:hypothetical protein
VLRQLTPLPRRPGRLLTTARASGPDVVLRPADAGLAAVGRGPDAGAHLSESAIQEVLDLVIDLVNDISHA